MRRNYIEKEEQKYSKINSKNYFDQINSLYNVVYQRYKADDNRKNKSKKSKIPNLFKNSLMGPEKKLVSAKNSKSKDQFSFVSTPKELLRQKQLSGIEDLALNPQLNPIKHKSTDEKELLSKTSQFLDDKCIYCVH
jgi:hypothetical protein